MTQQKALRRRSKLHEISDQYGNRMPINPRTIDPVLYFLAEWSETEMGPEILSGLEEIIGASGQSCNTDVSLQFLADRVLRKYLVEAFREHLDKELLPREFRPLTHDSYTDYLMLTPKIEAMAFQTKFGGAASHIAPLLFAYEARSANDVCKAAVLILKPCGVHVLRNLMRDLGKFVRNPPAVKKKS